MELNGNFEGRQELKRRFEKGIYTVVVRKGKDILTQRLVIE